MTLNEILSSLTGEHLDTLNDLLGGDKAAKLMSLDSDDDAATLKALLSPNVLTIPGGGHRESLTFMVPKDNLDAAKALLDSTSSGFGS